MLFKVFVVAGWVAVSAISAAHAQSLAGPAEMPPASFKGSQYVDSRGCVFLRAGVGGRVNWVPRISRNRRALCGQSPAAAAASVARDVVNPAPQPVAPVPQHTRGVGSKPMETIASQPRRSAPRVVTQTAPRAAAPVAVATRQTAPRASAPTVRRQNGCPAASPYGARVTLTDGRRSLLCSSDPGFDVRAAASRVQVSRGSQQATSRPAPQYKAPAAPAYVPKAASARVSSGGGYHCPASAPVARRYAVRGGGSTVMCTTAGGEFQTATPPLALGERTEIRVPKGYRKAWKDDRLNPDRGLGTARGQAQQDQVWTRDIPAELVADVPVKKTAKRKKTYTTSSSNAPRKATGGRYFVQVGTFGVAANAARTASRLQGLGLPVAKSRITSKGRKLQIVMAGPFGDAGAAKAALSAARRSGFGDAFIR